MATVSQKSKIFRLAFDRWFGLLIAVYEGGGKIWRREDTRGIVFLETDWDGSSMPMDLVEVAGMAGSQFEAVDPWERAKLGGYAKIGAKVVFLLEPERFPYLFKRNDREVFLACEWNGWAEAINDQCWKLDLEGENLCLWMNWEDLTHLDSFAFKFITDDGIWLGPPDPFPGVEENFPGAVNFIFEQRRTGKDMISFHISGSPDSHKLDFLKRERPIGEFGYRERSNGSWFRAYAPRAKQVNLEIIENDTENVEIVRSMISQDDGSWTVEFPEKSTGKLYRLAITHDEHDTPLESLTKKVLDPYALATVGKEGPGIAINPPPPVPQESMFAPPDMANLVIAEAHLRDLLAHAPCALDEEERKEFRGLSKWLKSEDCYLRKLGVNAVELQPVLEFDSESKEEYHWGYMPVSFMAPASAYASDPKNGSAITEFKELVKAFHDAGLAVILDVVYNHVGIPNHLAGIDRELYFSTDEIGRLTNHSGCGNDLNCQSEAARKLVLDSVIHLVRSFDVDGFRFDLGELIGIELLGEIEEELKKIKPGIILIAEPWSFRGRLPERMNLTGYSLWSDSCREKILDFVKEDHPQPNIVFELLRGILDKENEHPWQSVNYLESHDDYAFIDRLCKPDQWKDGKPPYEIERKARLALGLVLLAPGIPMISAGQDFLRGKKGVRNTYQRGDLNALNYSQASKFEELSEWVRSLIEFRLSDQGRFLRPEKLDAFSYHEIWPDNSRAFGLGIEEKGCSRSWLLLINPADSPADAPNSPAGNLAEATLLWGQKITKPGQIAPFDIQVLQLT